MSPLRMTSPSTLQESDQSAYAAASLYTLQEDAYRFIIASSSSASCLFRDATEAKVSFYGQACRLSMQRLSSIERQEQRRRDIAKQ